jgi:hypothetical protein
MELGRNSWEFTRTMILMFPGAFILIGLFEAWVDRSLVDKHLGGTGGLYRLFLGPAPGLHRHGAYGDRAAHR